LFIAELDFGNSIQENGAGRDFIPEKQYTIYYWSNLGKGNEDKVLGPTRLTLEIDGYLYEAMAKREQQSNYVPFPSSDIDAIRGKTNAEMYAWSSADRIGAIEAIYGAISNSDTHLNHPDHMPDVFPDWQYVVNGYVIPANWQNDPNYRDGDAYGMGNVILKRMTDADGKPITVDWNSASNAGPITTTDYITTNDLRSRGGGYVIHTFMLVGNDLDPDWQATNPHGGPVKVGQKYTGQVTEAVQSRGAIVNADQPSRGSHDAGNFEVHYFPGDRFSGIDSFRYHTTDIVGNDAWGEAYIFVDMDVDKSLVNYMPEALDDEFTISRTGPAMLDVLANDRDPEGSALTIEKVGHPERNTDVGMPHFGTTEIVGGQIRYTPNGYFTGVDRFVYYALDDVGNRTRRGTVTLNITK